MRAPAASCAALALLVLGGAGLFAQSARSKPADEPLRARVEAAPASAPTAAAAATDALLREAFAHAGIITPAAPAAESSAVVALGRTLFFDVRLSGNRNISCGDCHYHRSASSDGRSLAVGQGARGVGTKRVQASGKLLGRRAPALYNRALLGKLFWDGRVGRSDTGALHAPVAIPAAFAEQVTTPLAVQALIPPLLAEEMRGEPGSNELADAPSDEAVWTAIMKRLLADSNLRTLFGLAYPGTRADALHFGHAARAIAAFEAQQWLALRTPLDAFLAGKDAALSVKAKRGAALFVGKASCVSCHSGPLLTDEKLHALATPQIGPGFHEPQDDKGGGDYRFRTPPLRNVAIAGPWMHDGCFTTLGAAVRHHLDALRSLEGYSAAQLAPELQESVDEDPSRRAARAAALDPLLAQPVRLDAEELDALLAFLDALTDGTQVDKLSYRMSNMMVQGMMPPMMASMWDKDGKPKDAKPKGMAMPMMMGR